MLPDSETTASEDQLEPPPLDPAALERRKAALRQIRRFGDPVLKSRAAEVDAFNEALRNEIERMILLMNDAIGVGLAATQVGTLRRFFVYRVDEEGEPQVVVNPVIEWASDEEESSEEGCLSLPDVHVEVTRPIEVRVTAQDRFGEELTIEAAGLEARVIQHEIDHLDGILIIDRASRGQRREAMSALREFDGSL